MTTIRARRSGLARGTLRALALLGMLLMASSSAVGAPGGGVLEVQARLLEKIRAYRASLDPLLALQQTQAARAEAQAARRRELVERGIISRREAQDVEQEALDARRRVEKTRARMEEADAAMGDTLAAIELANLPKAAPSDPLVATGVIVSTGATALDASAVSTLEEFFQTRFRRPMPVSARGQTETHDRLGLDHRHAIDVAVHPDSDEGRALMDFLRGLRIPFLAFRQAIPGAATGAHVHVGPASHRLATLGVPRG